MRLRSAADGDRHAVLALGVAEEAAWFGEEGVISTEEVGEWIDGEGGVARGVVAVDDGGRVRGFASPGWRDAVFVADPALTEPLADEMLPWLHRQRDSIRLMTFAGDAGRIAAFERHGLRHCQSSFTLTRPESVGRLPAAAFPDGVRVTSYVLGDADDAVHRLIYVDAAWASVAGHGDRDVDEWREMVRPCRSLFVAHRDHRPIGWAAGRLLESGRAHVTMLAVAKTERGRGLGRALLLHVFTDLQRAGASGLGLDVVAHNETALGLYRSVGMEIEREWRTYGTLVTADVPPPS